MGEFVLTPIDGGLVVLIMAVTQSVKSRIAKRWVPVIPYVLGFLVAVPAVIYYRGGLMWFGVSEVITIVSGALLEGAKLGLAASGVFKLYHTTVMGG